jgi:hypothetical protein
VWNQQNEQEMYKICDDQVDSIKRVMKTDNFILRTRYIGLKLLSISDLESRYFNIQLLLEVKDGGYFTDSIQVYFTPSQIVIAAAHNELDEDSRKGSIKLIKLAIT